MATTVGPKLSGMGRSNSSNVYVLLDATDQNSHSGDYEDGWLDLSGNDRHCYRLSTPTTNAASGTSGNPDEDTPRFTRDGLEFYGLNANSKFQFGSTSGTGTRYDLSNSTNGITVLAVIKTTSTNSTTASAADPALPILSDTTSGVISGFGIHGGKVRLCAYSGSAWAAYDSNSSVNDGEWHQIGFTMGTGDPCDVKFYIDGELDRTVTALDHSGLIRFNAIGVGYNSSDLFVGSLRNLIILNTQLNDSEIRSSWLNQKNLTGGRGPYTGPEGNIRNTGGRFFAELKYRQIINYNYVGCGYKSASPWKNVHKTIVSTDQTTNLGTLMQYGGSYVSGACSLNIFYIWGASDSFAGNTTQTVATNMFTESSYTLTSVMNMLNSRDDSATVFKEHDYAWINGGGNANIDKFNFWTESMATSSLTGGNSGNSASFSDQYYGYWGSGAQQRVTFATDTLTSWTSYFVHPQQKGISSKLRKGYCGNEGSYAGGYNLRRWHFPTDTNIGNVAKPQTNCGEENYTMGQDHQYMLGNYDGAQNNENWKWYYATDTGTANVNGLSPTAQAGQSSGHCAWRE